MSGSKIGGFYDSDSAGVIRFAITLIAFDGDDSSVDDAVSAAVACLQSDALPDSVQDCDSFRYYDQSAQLSMLEVVNGQNGSH